MEPVHGSVELAIPYLQLILMAQQVAMLLVFALYGVLKLAMSRLQRMTLWQVNIP